MKVGVAQTRPVTADIARNIQQHKTLIARAVSSGIDIFIFPELSLTGYEPTLAQTLAIDPEDKRLDVFQQISDTHRLIIGAGIPTRHGDAICISMALFQPGKPRQLYSKKYLHADEEPFFVSGQHGPNRVGKEIALAICYEISIPQHAEEAFSDGASIYIASVAKFMHGIDKALARLAEIGSSYSMTVLMSNSVGQADGYECAGKSSIWNNKGGLLGQLDGYREGVLIFDTDTEEVIEIY
ncbi:MAG: carbon-nitrogen hydrolase family protein [Sphingobacteriales bacterium 50-39]|nr:carbon-nitrogen hydrolase family protein [Sphingobacteriales bacterium]OJW53820.1 MAG: carbon-nitrogen hydrolase family protein [Sphingobacteriales bacterium 50-39]